MDMLHPQTPELATAVSLQNGKPMTTSLAVAKYFGKAHDKVMRDIKRLISPENGLSPAYAAANFGGSIYQITGGKQAIRTAEMYQLSFNGFVMLVMGYQGPKAMELKEAYIAEFDRMKAELEAIKDHTIKMVEDKLFSRYPHWREALAGLQTPQTSGANLDRQNGWSEGRTNRAKKSLTAWGLISPEVRAQMDKAHRQYASRMAAITRQAQREQMQLNLEGGAA